MEDEALISTATPSGFSRIVMNCGVAPPPSLSVGLDADVSEAAT